MLPRHPREGRHRRGQTIERVAGYDVVADFRDLREPDSFIKRGGTVAGAHGQFDHHAVARLGKFGDPRQQRRADAAIAMVRFDAQVEEREGRADPAREISVATNGNSDDPRRLLGNEDGEAPIRAMYGRRPRCKRNLTFSERSGAAMYPACECGRFGRGPDVIR